MGESSKTLLLVDDDPRMLRILQRHLQRAGFGVLTAADGRAALEVLREQPVSLILSDIKMPELDGMALLDEVEVTRPGTPVILMTAFGTIKSAVEAMQRGAADYVSKPFQLSEILLTVQRNLEQVEMRQELNRLRAEVAQRWEFQQMVGKSAAMQRVFQSIERAAAVASTVLISGETGTGKEMAARAIHDLSPLKDKAFVVVDCSTIPETLFESELFGVVRGAYTGADRNRRGLFEMARGGTLFLDEIACLSPPAQAKLLRAIHERSIRRVGSDEPVDIDVRYLVATNRDLKKSVETGEFRDDLYYRLNVLQVKLPPLRERPEDIPLLAAHYLGRAQATGTSDVESFDERAHEALLGYRWPGNVRELVNAVEYSIAQVVGKTISFDDLPPEVRAVARHEPGSAATASPGITKLNELIDQHIASALDATRGNRSAAARLLGIDRRTLQRHLSRGLAGASEPDNTAA